MLEQLVESKNTQIKSRSGYLLTTFVLVVGLAFSGVLWSLFAQDFGMGNEEFALSSLLTPVPMPADAPPPPAPREPKQTAPSVANQTTRQTNMLRTDESPLVPKEISTDPNTLKSRPNTPFTLSNRTETDFQPSGAKSDDRNTGSGNDFGDSKDSGTSGEEIVKKTTPPPPLTAKKEPVIEDKKPAQKVTQTLGVINGKATSLPKPQYPAAARAINAQGDVNVQVLIDEAGNVISARAVSGHPLLRAVSEGAARNAKFSPTLLSNQPVKVSGIIVYKFTK